MNISTSISYCKLDRRFIHTTIRQSLIFSNDIIVVCFDRLLNGDSEELDVLDDLKAIDPDRVRVLVLPYDRDQSSRHHHNQARWQAQKHAKNNHVLLLDADEIPEGETTKQVLNQINISSISSMSFMCYWYFRSSRYQATTKEGCGMLVDKTKFGREHFFSNNERWGFRTNPDHIESMTSPNGLAFFHHFSWARTKEEMLIKTSSWGHKHDRNWQSLIDQEFSHDFNGTDFVHGYSYNIVDDIFDLRI